MKNKHTFLVLIIALLVAACASRPVSNSSLNEAKTIADDNTINATVLVVREVQLKIDSDGKATALGKSIGSYSGIALGSGVLSAAGSVAGGLVGEAIGSGIDEFKSKQKAIEILVKTDKGKTLLVTQLENETFKPGDKVTVITIGEQTHVTRRVDFAMGDDVKQKTKQPEAKTKEDKDTTAKKETDKPTEEKPVDETVKEAVNVETQWQE